MQVKRTQSVQGSGKPEYQSTNVDLQHGGGPGCHRAPPPTHTSPGAVTKAPGDKGRVTERELLCQNGELRRLIEGCAEETKFAGVSATLCAADGFIQGR